MIHGCLSILLLEWAHFLNDFLFNLLHPATNHIHLLLSISQLDDMLEFLCDFSPHRLKDVQDFLASHWQSTTALSLRYNATSLPHLLDTWRRCVTFTRAKLVGDNLLINPSQAICVNGFDLLIDEEVPDVREVDPAWLAVESVNVLFDEESEGLTSDFLRPDLLDWRV